MNFKLSVRFTLKNPYLEEVYLENPKNKNPLKRFTVDVKKFRIRAECNFPTSQVNNEAGYDAKTWSTIEGFSELLLVVKW